MTLTIMTFNIQHGVDHARRLRTPDLSDVQLIDLNRAAEAIRRFQPDIVSLNEVRDAADKPGFSEQTRYLAEACGFPYYFFGEALSSKTYGPYGNALLSKYPMDPVERVMIPDPDPVRPDGHYETRCVICASVRLPSGTELCVMNTHFGLEPEEAANAVDTVLSLTDPAKPTIFMGDLNLEPDSPCILKLHTVYRDSADLLPEDTKTYPSHAPEVKIDYIMACGTCRFLHAEVPELVVSDHRPYIVQVEV